MKERALKAGFWYVFSNFFVKGLVFITLPIFTRLMCEKDIGLFSNISSWFTIFSIVGTFELYSSISIARFDYKEELNEYVASCLVLGTIITSVFYIIVLIFNEFFSNILLIDKISLNIIFIYLLVYPAMQIYILKNQIEYNYFSTVVVTILNAILSTVFSVALVVFLNNKLLGRVIGFYTPSIFLCIVLYIILIKKSKKISTKYWKYALAISFPLIWHLLSGYLLNSADKIMITRLLGPDYNALYSVAYTISMVATLLWSSMNNAWSPWAYEQMDKKNYNALKENSKPYFKSYFIIVFCMMLVTPELLLLMGGGNYVEAKYVMPPVITGYIFQFLYSFYVNIEFYLKKQKYIALGTFIAMIINLILNYIFIPKYGYVAAAYTTLIGYMSLFIIHFLLVRKNKCDSWYDTSFFLKYAIISVLGMFIVNKMYELLVIRYIIFILLLLFFFYWIFKNRYLIVLIKKIKK